jgi:2-phospho-L-lactate guanylyltransferase
MRWQVVLPVKGGSSAKTRMGPPGPDRDALARAMSLDCVEAVTAAEAVERAVVVTGDATVAASVTDLGALVVPEARPGAGLLPAVGDGLAAAGPGPVAVLLADLPALRPEDVTEALDAVREALAGGASAVLVPDADGTGTVLLAAARRSLLRPAFGPHSARAHERAGAHRLDLELPRLRRDVDTADELADAAALGVGPRTAALLPSLSERLRVGVAVRGAAGA